jgi:hypothetical protein
MTTKEEPKRDLINVNGHTYISEPYVYDLEQELKEFKEKIDCLNKRLDAEIAAHTSTHLRLSVKYMALQDKKDALEKPVIKPVFVKLCVDQLDKPVNDRLYFRCDEKGNPCGKYPGVMPLWEWRDLMTDVAEIKALDLDLSKKWTEDSIYKYCFNLREEVRRQETSGIYASLAKWDALIEFAEEYGRAPSTFWSSCGLCIQFDTACSRCLLGLERSCAGYPRLCAGYPHKAQLFEYKNDKRWVNYARDFRKWIIQKYVKYNFQNHNLFISNLKDFTTGVF